VRIFNRSTLQEFWEKHADAEQPLRAWFAEVSKAKWEATTDVTRRYRSADFLPGDRIVFNIKGNTYRLVVAVKYRPFYCVYIRFIGTHAEYDRIDAAAV
jgi:mRNA interferase HigB